MINNYSSFVHQNLQLSQTDISQICQQWKILKMSLFGSILREDFNSNSDIDILVQFTADARQGLLTLVKLKHKLEEITHRSIDIVVKESVENSDN